MHYIINPIPINSFQQYKYNFTFIEILLLLLPCRYFRKSINIFCEFIPQMIFFNAIFGYLVVVIFYKWVHFDATNAAQAPALLIGKKTVNYCLWLSACIIYSSAIYFKKIYIILFYSPLNICNKHRGGGGRDFDISKHLHPGNIIYVAISPIYVAISPET